MMIGFSYLMAIYSSLVKKENGYFVALPSREVQIIDDAPYLEFFANGGSIESFMKDASVWGEDLSLYDDFVNQVVSNVDLIKSGKSLI